MFSARYSSGSSGSAPSLRCASSSACFASNASEMYLRKIGPSTTCLYSAASMLLRSASAACHSFASKPSVAPLSLPLLFDRPRAIIAPPSQPGRGIYHRQFTIALFRRQCGAFAQMLQAAVDPQFGQLFLHAVLRQAAAQGAEIDAVHLLVLVEAGKDDCLGTGYRVVVALQALRADLLHHALHRRVDRRDCAVVGEEIALQPRLARLGDSGHHSVRADRDDAVNRRERDLNQSQRAPAIGLDRLDDVADKGEVLRAARCKPRRLVAAPHDAVGGVLDLLDLVAVLHELVASEIEDARAARTERGADGEQDRIA